MKNIVIVGAGPIGLLLAIKLKKLGMSVIVIDPRVNHYNRPGTINRAIFDVLEKEVGQAIQFSSSRHIKDVERALFKMALALKVDILQYRFEAFSEEGLIISNLSGDLFTIPCDLAFDATGSARVLMNAVNKLETEPSFPLVRMADNPVKDHFIAYVKMSEQDIAFMRTRKKYHKATALKQALAFEKMRTELGWTKCSDPDFHIRILGKNKVCFYYEIPEGLNKDNYETWLTNLLELKLGKPNMHFQRLTEHKPRFMPFKVDPHMTSVPFFMGNKQVPPVFPIGDALCEADYRAGFGITGGVDRLQALLASLTIKDGEILHIDRANYAEKLAAINKDYQAKLQEKYAEDRELSSQALLLRKRAYKKAMLDSKASELSKKKIKSGLYDIALFYLQLANQSTDDKTTYIKKALKIYFSRRLYDAELVAELIQKNVNLFTDTNQQFQFVFLALCMAAKKGESPLIGMLLKNIDIRFNGEDICEIIKFVSPNNIQYSILENLIQKLNLREEDENSWDAAKAEILHLALFFALKNQHFEEAKILIAQGANIDLPDAKGNSELHIFVKHENITLAKTLLEAGANPNSSNAHKKTPLMHAVKNDDINMVKCLLHYGANPLLTDEFGKSALDYAEEDSDIFQLLHDATLKWRFLKQGDASPVAILRNIGSFRVSSIQQNVDIKESDPGLGNSLI